MGFELKKKGSKTEQSTNRTIYMPLKLVEKVEKVSAECERSFNSTINEMVEFCINDMERQRKEQKTD